MIPLLPHVGSIGSISFNKLAKYCLIPLLQRVKVKKGSGTKFLSNTHCILTVVIVFVKYTAYGLILLLPRVKDNNGGGCQ